jgi:hypothetical protein
MPSGALVDVSIQRWKLQISDCFAWNKAVLFGYPLVN